MSDVNEQSSESNPIPETLDEANALFDSVMKPGVETSEPTEGETTEENSEPSENQVSKDSESQDDLSFILKHKDFEDGERAFSRDKVTEYAQKGFDYELKMHRLKTERQEFDEKMTDLESKQSDFSKKREYWENIDKYMEENPDFAETVRNAWDQKRGQNTDNMSPEYQALQSTIDSLRDRLDAQDKDKQDISEKVAQESFVKSTAEYKDKNNDFDWETKDEFGDSLQDRIEKHAVDSGIKNFKVAANSYLFDQHLKRTELKAKEQVAKDLQQQKKNGLGPITDRSIRETKEATNISSMSYEDLAGEALREIGID